MYASLRSAPLQVSGFQIDRLFVPTSWYKPWLILSLGIALAFGAWRSGCPGVATALGLALGTVSRPRQPSPRSAGEFAERAMGGLPAGAQEGSITIARCVSRWARVPSRPAKI